MIFRTVYPDITTAHYYGPSFQQYEIGLNFGYNFRLANAKEQKE